MRMPGPASWMDSLEPQNNPVPMAPPRAMSWMCLFLSDFFRPESEPLRSCAAAVSFGGSDPAGDREMSSDGDASRSDGLHDGSSRPLPLSLMDSHAPLPRNSCRRSRVRTPLHCMSWPRCGRGHGVASRPWSRSRGRGLSRGVGVGWTWWAKDKRQKTSARLGRRAHRTKGVCPARCRQGARGWGGWPLRCAAVFKPFDFWRPVHVRFAHRF